MFRSFILSATLFVFTATTSNGWADLVFAANSQSAAAIVSSADGVVVFHRVNYTSDPHLAIPSSTSVTDTFVTATWDYTQLGGITTLQWTAGESLSNTINVVPDGYRNFFASDSQVSVFAVFSPTVDETYSFSGVWADNLQARDADFAAQLTDDFGFGTNTILFNDQYHRQNGVVYSQHSDGSNSGILVAGHTYVFQSVTNIDDLNSFSNAFAAGEFIFTASAVPEPSSISLLSFGVLALLGCYRLRLRRLLYLR